MKLLVFHIGVGKLSASKAEEFVEKQKNKLSEQLEIIKNHNCLVLFLPTRSSEETKIKLFTL